MYLCHQVLMYFCRFTPFFAGTHKFTSKNNQVTNTVAFSLKKPSCDRVTSKKGNNIENHDYFLSNTVLDVNATQMDKTNTVKNRHDMSGILFVILKLNQK